MGRILIIPNSDFSQNRIEKVDMTKQVENTITIDSHTPTSYSSSIVSVNNPSLKK